MPFDHAFLISTCLVHIWKNGALLQLTLHGSEVCAACHLPPKLATAPVSAPSMLLIAFWSHLCSALFPLLSCLLLLLLQMPLYDVGAMSLLCLLLPLCCSNSHTGMHESLSFTAAATVTQACMRACPSLQQQQSHRHAFELVIHCSCKAVPGGASHC